jgi:DNA-binding LacI/PurR family transcriptional regulator/signal transduction histidine kinase/ActR/RegA family two-component response regulator
VAVTYLTDPGSTSDGRQVPRAARSRKTVAVLLDYMNFFGGAYENHMRASFQKKGCELDINLIFYFGRGLYEPHPACPPQNAIFDLIHSDRIDGVVAISSVLTSSCGMDKFIPFMQRYRPMPLCSVGVKVEGVPSLVVDNALGISDVVAHLVRVHARTRIAFVSGPAQSPESQVRLGAYEAALTRSGYPIDPELIVEGGFTARGGYAAVEALLARSINFDSVVAANDEMALGAIHALREHQLRVPHDVIVTGFDDLRLARLGSPPLTTVSQPFDDLAERALGSILAQAAGETVPDLISCPTRLMVRRSCGCTLSGEGWSVPPGPSTRSEQPGSPAAYLRRHRARILRELLLAANSGWSSSERDCEALLVALSEELGGALGVLVDTLEGMLEAPSDNDRYRSIHMVIVQLRAALRPATTLELERVWFDALDVLALSNTTAQMQHRLELDEHYMQLLVFGERTSIAFDLSSLRAALEMGIPSVGVQTAFISRCVDDTGATLQPLVCLCRGVAHDLPVQQFAAHQLFPLPFEVGSPEERQTLLVFPLSFEAQKLGVAVFDYTPARNVYSTLRDQISTTLRIVSLHQDLLHQTMLHERSVQERLATTHRIHSLSLLAGGVAHDLNNTLGPVVALPELILDHLELLPDCPGIVREDLQSIQSAALRASQTIKDLLTLGRQGRMPRRATDLCEVMRNCLGPDFCRPVEAVHPGLSIRLLLPPTPVVVHASEAHLARAVMNLVLNAVEATRGPGQVVVHVAQLHLPTALTGYESVDAGNYAIVSVTDTGHGMPADDLSRVFEPFFSKKLVGERSGSGLGLAIVHGVVKEHEGFVDVQSQVNVGTTFTLYFPVSEEAAHSERLLSVVPRGSARILIVDDDPIQLRTGRRVLMHLGYEVTTMASGRDALTLLRNNGTAGDGSGFDLLILDMLLNEDRDGLEVLERVLELFPGQKAILVSGHAPGERAERAAGHGVQWLSKPFTVESLAQAVNVVLGPRIPFLASHGVGG